MLITKHYIKHGKIYVFYRVFTHSNIYKAGCICIFMELNFENFTIGQLREMTKEFLSQNPDFKTAEQLLEEKQQ